MRARTMVFALLLTCGLGSQSPTWAEDPPSLEERIKRLEQRIEALEKKLESFFQALEARQPDLLAARKSAHETAAQATLRNFIVAQAQFQQSAKADVDQDGTGEYGGFLELSGGAAGRMLTVLVPPVLSGAFRILDGNGTVSRSGYFFRMYLVGPEGVGVGEPQTGFHAKSPLDANLCEQHFCCYAWPVLHGTSSMRTFATNQTGDIFETESTTYSGADRGPAADAAFVTKGRIDGELANGVKGNDGNVWKVMR